MKIKDILEIKESLYNLGNLLLPEPYTKCNYEVYKIIKLADSALENFSIQQLKVIKKYGTKQEDGNYVLEKTNPNYNQCYKEIEDLGEITVDIPFEITINPSVVPLKAIDIYNLIECGILKEEQSIEK